jgi:hypothetical protein
MLEEFNGAPRIERGPTGTSDFMHRTIAAAAIVFAVAAFALQNASLGPFEEPLLLLSMGTLFLLVGKLFAPHSKRTEQPAEPEESDPEPEPAPQLVHHRETRP